MIKKYIGAICSAVAGVFAFILLSLNWITMKMSYSSYSLKESANAWEIMEDYSDIDGYTLFKLAAIVMIIMAVVLIVLAIMMILQNLNILKLNLNLNKINNIALVVFVGLVVLTIAGALIMCGELSGDLSYYEIKSYIAVGAYLMFIVSLAACVVSFIASKSQPNKIEVVNN